MINHLSGMKENPLPIPYSREALMAECVQCGLPDEVPFSGLDRSHNCRMCRDYPTLRKKIGDPAALERDFETRMGEIRGRYPYDVVLGFSGGRDSSFVLSELVHRHRLKVLAITIDNGFLTELALRNIHEGVHRCGVAHEFIRPEPRQLAALYKMAIGTFGVPCVACYIAGYALLTKVASERGVPFGVHGRSRAQMYRFFSTRSLDPILPLTLSNLQPYSREVVLSGHRRLKRNLFLFLASRPRRLLTLGTSFWALLKDASPSMAVLSAMEHPTEFLGYFNFFSYGEKDVREGLGRLDWWEKSGGEPRPHFDCAIHSAAMWLHRKRQGYSFEAGELCYRLRAGELSAEEARDRLAHLPVDSEPPEEEIALLAMVAQVEEGNLRS